MSARRRSVPVWMAANGHIPVPAAHRGPDRTVIVDDNDTRYLIDRDNPDAWLAYDGCISEVVL